ncbi:response regulator [Oscillatoria sp. FACHB-1406]|uniref:ATP-binding response regulator n=1 Tax=Oscillatoria sp. FACHB-1406 TaxID=2692846 RepID=UPI00168257D6|nr:response regulator [Oscillatoria sp. FACHB-1406]MBD2579320.1 response regulator [Oscillatoria sp. FACHB-1406]
MTSEEALQLIEALLNAQTGKQLTLPEREILKAAWNNETYTTVAERLYLSLGYIKDLAAALWQCLSNVCGEKITKNNFRRIMEEQSNKNPSTPDNRGERDSHRNEHPKGNILIIDDSIKNLEFLTKVLSKRGYNVRGVTSGKMALIIIRHHSPDLILLNIEMPLMNGYDIYQSLKADEASADIPIVLLSAPYKITNKVRTIKVVGVDMAKIFEPEESLGKDSNLLNIQQQKLQLMKQIEQYKQTSEILSQSRTLLTSLLNNSKDGIAALEAIRDTTTEEIEDFSCLVSNRAFAKILGQKREELIGNTIQKKLIERLTPTLFDLLVEVVETGEEIEQEFYWENDDQQNWYCLSAVKFADGCSITIRNITEFKLLELRMKLAAHFQ